MSSDSRVQRRGEFGAMIFVMLAMGSSPVIAMGLGLRPYVILLWLFGLMIGFAAGRITEKHGG